MLVGGLVTLAGGTVWLAGGMHRLDDLGLDLHIRLASTIPASPEITLLDIDDQALRSAPEWPWPRHLHAGLVETLHRLGAKLVVLDVIFSDPTAAHGRSRDGDGVAFDTVRPDPSGAAAAPRASPLGLTSDPSASRPGTATTQNSSLRGPTTTRNSPPPGPMSVRNASLYGPDGLSAEDAALAAALAESGNVLLPMFFELAAPPSDPAAVMRRAREVLSREPRPTLSEFARLLGSTSPWSASELYRTCGMSLALERKFDLTESQLGADDGDRESIARYFPQAKRAAARTLAEAFLERSPDGEWAEFLRSSLPSRDVDSSTPDRSDLLRAFRAARSRQALIAHAAAVPGSLARRIPSAVGPTYPLDAFARSARGIGFATWTRETSGPVVRTLAPMATLDGRLVGQLGFLAGVSALGLDWGSVHVDGTTLTVGRDERTRRLPLDSRGQMLINWHVPGPSRQWEQSFRHVPITRLLAPLDQREAMEENAVRRESMRTELVRRQHADTPAEVERYLRAKRLLTSRRSPAGGSTDRTSSAPIGRGNHEQAVSAERATGDVETTEAAALVDRMDRDAATWLTRAATLWESEAPQTPEEREEKETILSLRAMFAPGGADERLAALNARLAEVIAASEAELRPMVEGKICLVGYTASAVADLVATPYHSAVPGVMVHANVLNMLLQNRPLARATPAIALLMLLASGAMMTGLACTRGALWGAGSAIGVLAALAVVGLVLFHQRELHVPTVPAAALVLAVWASVTVCRQLTEERARRKLYTALSQYTSPAVAARITTAATFTDLQPRAASVSCFFADLQGFTTLSERLGAERTQRVLNPYLKAVAQVLIDHDAMVNKFMGDGVFAFFNAPIWPCQRHALAACASALAVREAVQQLNSSFVEREIGESLVVRIGISTGEAFVGDYGSDTKLDYTCIGDTVNLAARLEDANKQYGTTVLVDEPTRQAAAGRFRFRSLGPVTLPGKTIAVPVHELVGVEPESGS